MYADMSINTELRASSASASAWVKRFVPLIRRGGRVLDLAAGSGRHTRLLLESGFAVCAVDRDISALLPLAASGCELQQFDLETGTTWQLGTGYDGIVVTNYLHRPAAASDRPSPRTRRCADLRDLRARQRAVRAPAQPRFSSAPRRTARSLRDADRVRLRAGRNFGAAARRHSAHHRSCGASWTSSRRGRFGHWHINYVIFRNAEYSSKSNLP